MKKFVPILMTALLTLSVVAPSSMPILADEVNAHEYTMDNGKKITIKDSDIVDAMQSKGDRADVVWGNKNISLINTKDFDLVPLVDGKWNKMPTNDQLQIYFVEGKTGGEKPSEQNTQDMHRGVPTAWAIDSGAWSWQGMDKARLGGYAYNYADSLKTYDSATKALASTAPVSGIISSLLKAFLPSKLLELLGKLAVADFRNEMTLIKNATDKTTDRGFGTAITYNNASGNFYDYFYNDSRATPQSALSKPDGSDSRTPNQWEKANLHKDFYLGWSCDYNSNGKWVGVGGNKTAY
ncbi:MAG: hypothetical protein LBT37_01580 [Lactobacillaceae bacterium]|jgi:hypothetical protein|nr:hypothetical protein [Lactobacillaceae bacterium]